MHHLPIYPQGLHATPGTDPRDPVFLERIHLRLGIIRSREPASLIEHNAPSMRRRLDTPNRLRTLLSADSAAWNSIQRWYEGARDTSLSIGRPLRRPNVPNVTTSLSPTPATKRTAMLFRLVGLITRPCVRPTTATQRRDFGSPSGISRRSARFRFYILVEKFARKFAPLRVSAFISSRVSLATVCIARIHWASSPRYPPNAH